MPVGTQPLDSWGSLSDQNLRELRVALALCHSHNIVVVVSGGVLTDPVSHATEVCRGCARQQRRQLLHTVIGKPHVHGQRAVSASVLTWCLF